MITPEQRDAVMKELVEKDVLGDTVVTQVDDLDDEPDEDGSTAMLFTVTTILRCQRCHAICTSMRRIKATKEWWCEPCLNKGGVIT